MGSYKTAWTWLHKFRRAMVRPGRDRLTGRVEVDETYLGGLEEGVRGRQTERKSLIVIAAQEDGPGIGRIRMKRILEASGDSLMAFVKEAIELGSTVHTVMPWLMPDEIAGAGTEILATPANIEGWTRVCALSAPGDAECEQSLNGSIARMRKAASGTYVAMDDYGAMFYGRVEGVEPRGLCGWRFSLMAAAEARVNKFPDKKIKLMLAYPMTTGRNFDEILRVLDSMLLTSKHKVATPVSWKEGQDVIIVPAVSDDDAKQKYPNGWKTLKPYLRVVAEP